jgi:hypothetical protein
MNGYSGKTQLLPVQQHGVAFAAQAACCCNVQRQSAQVLLRVQHRRGLFGKQV